MARYRILHWREIPSLVEAADDSHAVQRPLSSRFQELIDAVAMRAGASEAAAYVEGWGHSDYAAAAGSAESVAEAVAAAIEAGFAGYVARHLPPG